MRGDDEASSAAQSTAPRGVLVLLVLLLLSLSVVGAAGARRC